jgi:succinoglycan biosynthesis transport protein ExoP
MTQGQDDSQYKRALEQSDVSASSGYTNAQGDVEIDLRRILMTFWRRRYIIVFMMLIFMGAAYYASERMTPLFKTASLVLVKQEQLDVKNISSAQFLTKDRYDTTQILSEVEIIRSRNLMLEVIRRLNLYDVPSFTHDLQHLQKFHEMKNSAEARQGFKALKLQRHSDQHVMTNEEKWLYEKELGILIGRVLKKLEIRPIAGSMVISIKFTSPSPERAKQVVDAVADVYVNDRLNRKFAATRKVTLWLDGRLDTLRAQLREAENAVEQYRADKELISGSRAEVTAQQISEINTQLVLSKTRLAEARARLEQITGWAENPVKLESTANLGDGNVLGSLILRQSSVTQSYAELSKRYGEKHPEMIRINAELKNVRIELRKELERTAEHLDHNMSVELTRMEVLSQNLKELEEKRKLENQAAIKLRELEGEAATIRQIFATFLESYKRSDQQEDLQEADAQVLSYATVPLRAFHPNKQLLMSLSAILGLFAALGLIVLLENLDNAYRSAIQIEKDTGLTCVGSIPGVKASRSLKPADYVLKNPTSVTTEALRSMKTVMSLHQKHHGKPLDVLAITSSLPGEGKSTMSVWLGRLSALSGRKVLLIDCDLRRPNIHNLMGYENSLSLVEYLSGQLPLEDVICKDEQTGLDVILGRSVANTALDLLTSDYMVKLMAFVREEYDFVILDTPASLAVSDPCVLAEYADHMVYSVQWDKTPRELVLSGVKQFKDLGFKNMSLAFTLVDLKKQAKYGYGETAYYYTHYTDGA